MIKIKLATFLFIFLKTILLFQSSFAKEIKINTLSECDIINLEGAKLKNNEILLFWVEVCKEGEPLKIFTKQYSTKGVITKKDTELSFNIHESIFFRKLFSLENGGFGVFIGTYETDSYNIWANIFDNNFNQSVFDKSFSQITNQGTLSQQLPIFHKLSNGNFLLINVDIQIMPFLSMRVVSIQAKLFSADLSLLAQKAPLNLEKMINDAYYVNVVNTANDGFALIWSRQISQSQTTDVVVRNFDNDIIPQTDELVIPNTENKCAIQASKLLNGNFILIFDKKEGTYGKIYNPMASQIGNEFKIFSDLNSYTLSIKSLSNGGKFLATWQNGLDLNGAVYDENGNLITENFKVNTYTSNTSKSFEQIIIEFDDGGFFVAFDSIEDSVSQRKGLFGQFFSAKAQKLDPEPLLCNPTSLNFPVNSTIRINLVDSVKTLKIKLHSLPSFGKLIDVYNKTEAEINIAYSGDGLKYVNLLNSKNDYFNFSSVDGFNEGSQCQANLLMYDQIPESKNITFTLNRHENSAIDFIKYISDHEAQPKDLFISFNSLPICGKIFSYSEEITSNNLNLIYKATNLFTYKSLNCSVGAIETFTYSAVNKFDKSSNNSYVKITILKPFPVSEGFNLYFDKEKDKLINFTSHISDELTDKIKLKILFIKSPICGGKIFEAESKKEIILNQLYLATQSFLYKISTCEKSEDLFSYSIINEDLLQSPETEVKLLLKQPPNAKEISIAVVEKGKICFKFDKYKVNDFEDPFDLLNIIFTQAPFLGEIFDSKNNLVYLNQKYSILTEFCYFNQKIVNDYSEDLYFYTAVNCFQLESREARINVKINPNVKWWQTPMSILAFIFSGCAALATFIFTLCKCKAKGFCCWRKKVKVNDQLNDPNKFAYMLLQENV